MNKKIAIVAAVVILATVAAWFFWKKNSPALVEQPRANTPEGGQNTAMQAAAANDSMGSTIYSSVVQQNPSAKLPEVNPFKTANTNPIKAAYQNPFSL